jgi:hypothetical protein
MGAEGRAGPGGAVEHAASIPTISAIHRRRRFDLMGIILLEALLALALLLFIVWWTMFAGRKRGEPPAPPSGKQGPSATPDHATPPTHSQPPHEPPQ